MPIHPGMVEPLAERSRDLYAGAEERLLGIIARQLAAGLESPTWAEQKLAAVQMLRRAAQGIVDELGKAVSLDIHDAVAEAYNEGHRAAVAEIGALSDDDRHRADQVIPNAQAIDRLAAETVDVVTSTHRSILRAVVDGFRAIVSEVVATPLLGIGTRRQATQDAMHRFAGKGITSFVDKGGRHWSLPAYAEMAVRTGVARAATEAHMRTLDDAGIELVIVSDSPRECPLCRPWERKILVIDGPPGVRTVEVEHAIEDDRMVPVRVAGSLDEARLAGLQHPNCRHSVSAYTPGITRVEKPKSDPEGYEAGQRQRAIERRIRRHKKFAAAAVTPEAKRAANAKVRQWQTAMRDHLAAHPDLRRLPKREQLDPSQLPAHKRPKRVEPTPAQVQAARVWSGDDRTPREMTDEQLADALHSGLLDDEARQRIEAEADRRDLAQLLDRMRPGGVLADDLTQFSDTELARAFDHLDDADTLRVMAELHRRDLATRLPDVQRDLVGMSDDQLAARGRGADPATLALLAAEAARRDLLARLFPGGNLLFDLTSVGDDELAWAMQYATNDELLRIAGEMDRREPVALPPPADTGDPVADLIADRNAVADTMAPAPSEEVWGQYAADDQPDGDTAPPADDGHDDAPRMTRKQARELYDDYVYKQYLQAEDDCRGQLLNPTSRASGMNPIHLFSGPARIAYAHASNDLKDWWEQHGRMTQAVFIQQATGQTQRWAKNAAINEAEQQHKR